MKAFVPNAKHVFTDRDSLSKTRRLFVTGAGSSPISVSALLNEMPAVWESACSGKLPYGLSPEALRECLQIAAQVVDRAADVDDVTAVLHDAKNLLRDAFGTIENVKLEISRTHLRRPQEQIDFSAQSLADMADLCSDLLGRWRNQNTLSLPAAPQE